MARVSHDILAGISQILNAQSDVFSSAQWGGRAYKLPGPNGSLKRPKLLAFVSTTAEGDLTQVTFKLDKKRAAEVIRRHDWIVREPFGSLGRAGWVLARVRTRAQLKVMAALLAESRELYPASADDLAANSSTDAIESSSHRDRIAGDPVARRIDRVMLEMKSNGWSPHKEDDLGFTSDAAHRPGHRARVRKSKDAEASQDKGGSHGAPARSGNCRRGG